MNKYVVFWIGSGKSVEVEAETSYQAEQKAKVEFEKAAGRKKVGTLSVWLAEKSGEQVVHIADF